MAQKKRTPSQKIFQHKWYAVPGDESKRQTPGDDGGGAVRASRYRRNAGKASASRR